MIAPIISVTGTKGKTTTVAIIADVLKSLGNNVLKVDTTGHFINGERRSTLEDSRRYWRLVPTVCPGRYLYEFMLHKELRDNGVAVLEAALGSSSSSGLGYRHHDIGVFLNVFEDHLGSSERLQTQDDIATAKQFVFERISPDNGWAIFNADDKLVCDKLHLAPQFTKLLPIGLDFSHFDIVSHRKAGGCYITKEGKELVLQSSTGRTVLADLTRIPWAFQGEFVPSVWNLMAAAAAAVAYNDGEVSSKLKEVLEAIRLDRYGGRLTVLKNARDVTVIADYAHEKNSLCQIGNLAKLLSTNGKTIGVVRLAHDRTDGLMRETADAIADSFDAFVVYDKIDGYWRQPKDRVRRFKEVIGRTSEVFATALAKRHKRVRRIVREDEAIQHAAEIAQPGDVVVVIVNDNIKRSIEFIQNSFEAEFV